MPLFRIVLKPDAVRDLDRFRKFEATTILERIKRHLRSEPTRESRSRIRRLRGPQPADYGVRVGAYRVFYRVVEGEIRVLRVMRKEETQEFLREEGP